VNTRIAHTNAINHSSSDITSYPKDQITTHPK
jgi:hypothetical protein